MTTIGLDLHKRESQLCIGHDDGRSKNGVSRRHQTDSPLR